MEDLLEESHERENFRDEQAGARREDQVTQGGLDGAGEHVGDLLALGEEADQGHHCQNDCRGLQ